MKIKVVILIEILYLLAAIFIPALPGWKMFVTTSWPKFEMIDDQQKKINVDKYLLNPTYSLNTADVIGLAEFICRKEITSKKIQLVFNAGKKYEFTRPDCKNKAI